MTLYLLSPPLLLQPLVHDPSIFAFLHLHILPRLIFSPFTTDGMSISCMKCLVQVPRYLLASAYKPRIQ